MLALPHTDWLRHELVVSGPAGTLAAFRAAARGAGAIPWHIDLDWEETRLLAPMASGGEAARSLARQLRLAVDAHHGRVLQQAANGGDCPLDLHRLVPVPERVLRLGAGDPAGDLWLWEHWGTTRALRHVRLLDGHDDRRLRRSAVLAMEFHAADWTPWRAVRQIRADWPALVLHVRPDYRLG